MFLPRKKVLVTWYYESNNILPLPKSRQVSVSAIVPTVYCTIALPRTYMAVFWYVVVVSTVIRITRMIRIS